MTDLSGGAPEQAPRWDLVDTESYGGGIRVLAPFLIVWGYVGIYRRKEYVGGATGGPRGRGRAQGVGRAPHPRGWWVAPLWYFLRSVFFHSKHNFRGVSGLLELCRIGL